MRATFNDIPNLIDNLIERVETLAGILENIQPPVPETPMSVEEVAEMLGCSTTTIYHSKTIPSHRVFSKRIFFRDEVIAWVKQGKYTDTGKPLVSAVKPGRRRKI